MRFLSTIILGVMAVVVSGSAVRGDDALKMPADFFDLTGQAGLPTYMKCDQTTRGGLEGVCDGEIKTIDTALFKKDFTLDLIFQTANTEGHDNAAVGIGENGHEGGWLLNSLECRFSGDRQSVAEIVFYHQSKAAGLTQIKTAGEHLLRFEKIGNTATFKFQDEYGGEEPDQIKFVSTLVVSDFRSKTAFLNRLNSALYLSGNMNWSAMRLRVDGKLIDPVLNADGFTVAETIKLPGTYNWIGERKNYFVAMSDETKSLDLIDKKSLKIIRQTQMDYLRRWDLCLSPTKPKSYVSVQKATDNGFASDILIVDETNGEVKEPSDFVGKYIKISPDGRVLYSAFDMTYKKGDQLLFNPDRIDVIPEYGDISIMFAFDITSDSPRELAAKNAAGANCQGLTVLSDGKRVSYLSYVGYPLYSNNIAAWDSTDFARRPVAYATKANKADCKHLAFHPELPIVAAASDAGAICFERESCILQKDRLSIIGSFDGTKVDDLIFSPDATNLILDCEQGDDHFLVKLKVNLSTEEAAVARKGVPAIRKPAVDPVEDGRIKA